MDSNELRKILDMKYAGKRIQYHVLPSDRLCDVNLSRYPILIVANDQPSNLPGGHWVGMGIMKRGHPLTFFCSYGLPIEYYGDDYKKFSNKFPNTSVKTRRALQSVNSNVCGGYALIFLDHFVKGGTLDQLYSRFGTDTRKNDVLAKKYIMHQRNSLKYVKYSCKNFKKPCCFQCSTVF
jgi:hypothetical protein